MLPRRHALGEFRDKRPPRRLEGLLGTEGKRTRDSGVGSVGGSSEGDLIAADVEGRRDSPRKMGRTSGKPRICDVCGGAGAFLLLVAVAGLWNRHEG